MTDNQRGVATAALVLVGFLAIAWPSMNAHDEAERLGHARSNLTLWTTLVAVEQIATWWKENEDDG